MFFQGVLILFLSTKITVLVKRNSKYKRSTYWNKQMNLS